MCRRGFGAAVAVIMLALGTLAFSMATLGAAASYADGVMRREARIQADLDATACLDSARLLLAKDVYLDGTVELADLGCAVSIANPTGAFPGSSIHTTVVADVAGVRAYAAAGLRF